MPEKILIVDDSPSTLMLMKFSLEKKGFEVKEAVNAEDAINIIEKDSDIICMVTDINMPGMSGIELVEKVRQNLNYKFLPVIVLTNPDNPGNVKKARGAGATGWLDKPFKPENLTNIIDKIRKRPGK
ncbi:MAG: response regulator [Desulfobacteraceae bacterium]|nr:response regulator [Desulfobacteraceae bacterium]MCB9494299.1 response regulator [Desulfobacteraceae bacterium]